MSDPIIDFHTHEDGWQHGDQLRKFGITHTVSIAFGYPSGYVRDVTTVAGMTPKPDWWVRFLKTDLSSLNDSWYRNLSNTRDGFYTFAPWISILTDVDAIKAEPWFKDSKMVKFIPVFDEVDDHYVVKLHELVGKLPQKCIMIHTGWGSSPVLYHNLIKHYPDKFFVLAHMKEDDDSDNVERQAIMRDCPNAYLEMSYLSSPKRIAQYVNEYKFGDRILFGSDWRSKDDDCTLQWMLKAIELAPISPEARRAILYDNARDLLLQIGIKLPK